MALRSPYKCSACKADWDVQCPTCAGCGVLQELPTQWNAFEVLGIDPALALNSDSLRERFYALSKQTHPDRFITADPQTALRAARWSTAVNRAYQTLRDQEGRVQVLRSAFSLPPFAAASKVPMELAETYFDLQDALTEPGSAEHLIDFKKQLIEKQAGLTHDWEALEASWLEAPHSEARKALLEKAANQLTVRRFLRSMLEDLEKKQGMAS